MPTADRRTQRTLQQRVEERFPQLQEQLSAIWPDSVFSRNDACQRFADPVTSWCNRQSRRLTAGNSGLQQGSAIPGSDETEVAASIERILRALKCSLCIDVLRGQSAEQTLSDDVKSQLREAVWSQVEPQTERIAAGFARSAAKRGLEEADLLQEAWSHFHAVVARFDPHHPRHAMFETWWDDVVSNLFLGIVRPRKSDVFHRGRGGIAANDAGTGDTPAEVFTDSNAADLREQRRQQTLRDSLAQVDEICTQLVQEGVCPWERVLAFQLYTFEGLTYQQVAQVLTERGQKYGTTQMFNFVKEVRDQIVQRFAGDPLGG